MRYPLDKPYTIGDGYGVRKAPVPGASTFHEGQDWGVKVGTSIHAPLAGMVYQKGAGGAAGRWIMLQHDPDTRTRYNHLQTVPNVARGERVAEGQVFAHTGGALDDPGRGASGGPHLHFGVYKRQANGSYKAIDPNKWLAQGSATGTETEKDEEEMLAIYEGPDTAAGKKWVDLRTGKAIRTVTKDEMVAVRAQRSLFPVLIVTLDAKEWKEFNK